MQLSCINATHHESDNHEYHDQIDMIELTIQQSAGAGSPELRVHGTTSTTLLTVRAPVPFPLTAEVGVLPDPRPFDAPYSTLVGGVRHGPPYFL